MIMNNRIVHSRNNSKGAALVITLVFLVLLTILGLSSMGTTAIEEKMAHNARDRNLAFQAAETALLTAETWIKSLATQPEFPQTNKGLFVPSTTTVPVWEDTTLVNWKTTNNLVVFPCVPLQIGACG